MKNFSPGDFCMRILFSFVFSSLLCTPLLAMDWDFVPQETKEPENASSAFLVRHLIGRHVHTTGEDEHINELRWNPQGTLLAVAANYRHPFIFNPEDNSVQEIPLDSQNTCYWPEHVAWNKSGKRLAIGTLNHTVSIFDVAKKCITRTMHEWNYEASPAVAWSPTAENTLAVCASKHSPVRMYHIPEDPSEPITHTDPIKLLDPAFDRRGYNGHPVRLEWRNGMIAMGYERGVCCMTTPDNQMRWTRYCENGTYPRPPLAVHPWKPTIAYAAPESWWNSATKKLERVVWRIHLRNSEKPYEESFIKEKELLYDKYVTDLSFSHDGRFLTAVSDMGLLTMNADTLEILNTIPLSEKTSCERAQWNPTQHQLAYSIGRELFITDPITIEAEKSSLLRTQQSCKNLKDLIKE
jgi:WD40 repeat protein